MVRVLSIVALLFTSLVALTPAANAEESSIQSHILLRYQELDTMWPGIYAAHGLSYSSPSIMVVIPEEFASSAGQVSDNIWFVTGPRETDLCQTVTPDGGSHYCTDAKTIIVTYGDIVKQWGDYGDFSVSFLLAHEWGHHLENLQYAPGFTEHYNASPAWSTFFELQADCAAGMYANWVWANGGMESGDIEEAFSWVGSIGSDMFGNSDPATWTHGSSAQRVTAFTTGYTINDCAGYV